MGITQGAIDLVMAKQLPDNVKIDAIGNRERCEVVAQVMHSQATDTGLRSNGSPGEVNHLDRSIPSGCRKHKWA